MASYRYWRLAIPYMGGGVTAVGVNELFFQNSNGVSLATGGTVICSSQSLSYPAVNAFDGSTTNLWMSLSGAFPHWIGYDFGVPVQVENIRVVVNVGSPSTFAYPREPNMVIAVSTDGTTWVPYPKKWWFTSCYADGSNNVYIRVTDLDPVVSVEWGVSQPTFLAADYQAAPLGTPFYYPGGVESFVHPPDLPRFGLATIRGTLKVLTTPSSRLVRLFDRGSGVKVREVLSNPDGTYLFEWLDPTKDYFVVGFDDPIHQSPVYNAAISDMVRPALETL